MNNGSKIEVNNLKYSTDGVNYHPVKSVSFKIHKKRNGTVLERWLYYHNHKKKRIRKKYRIDKLLIRGGKY